ncbi:MAG: ABC-2 family transporter protein, partial [Elusimicrobia bacterium]|nr:ABC-2 family transporter protein [Elusimicrobiota bacterium]
FEHVPNVAGYSLTQVTFFYLTFNIVDILAQLFFRGIYMIGRDIREGDMDFYLIQPVHPLFRISSNLIDFLDFITLIPVLVLTGMVLPKILGALNFPELSLRLILYGLLCANGVTIAFSIHVLIASLTVRTQQMESTVWLYRDVASLGRFPSDVYSELFRAILTFVFPIAVMVSFPSKALLGILSWDKVALAFFLSSILLALSLGSWKSALKHYCSVSS